LRRTLATLRDVWLRYPISWVQGRRLRDHFQHVDTFCLFIGHQRAGGSLVGSLLSAHPNVVIANELDVLRFVKAGFSREQIYALILAKDRAFDRAGRLWTGYQYQVPYEWQGSYDRLQVIGDKRAGMTAYRLAKQPSLLERLREKVGVRLRVVHVVRNPYDNIGTISMRVGIPLEQAADRYFKVCRMVEDMAAALEPPDELERVRHEELVARPEETIVALCRFLGIEASQDYLEACSALVHSEPHRSRHEVSWPPDLLPSVEARVDTIGFLEGYGFAD
jgi:hypothetical protein